jgi:hypothetical protein
VLQKEDAGNSYRLSQIVDEIGNVQFSGGGDFRSTVNKTAQALAQFCSLQKFTAATKAELSLCPGERGEIHSPFPKRTSQETKGGTRTSVN